MSETKKRTCVVAGVGPGVGVAVAKRFAREGFVVALLARRADELRRLAGEVPDAIPYPVDLLNFAAVRATFDRIARDLGDPSVLVYNAARWQQTPAMELTAAEFAADIELCATGALVCAQSVYAGMKRRGHGTILITGGGLALRPEYGAGLAGLTAGKSAVRGLTYALAPEVAADGIHVATVTIAGTVAKDTAFDPDRIAERFWALHEQPRAEWQIEAVFDGRA